MGKFANFLDVATDALGTLADRRMKIDELTDQLVRRTPGVDASQARRIAETLIDKSTTDVTWKY